MSYTPGTLVWTNFGTWHPGIVGAPEQLPTQGEPGQIPVIFSDGSGAHLDLPLIEPFEKDLEERKAHPEIVAIWDDFMTLANGGGNNTQTQGDEEEDADSGSEASEGEDDDILLGEDDEAKAARKAEKKAKKEAKKLAKKEKKEAKRAEKEAKKAAEKEDKKKKEKKSKKDDDDTAADDLAALLEENDTERIDMSAADRSQPTRGVRRTQLANVGGEHLEQHTGRIADLQMGIIKAHYNTVLAADVAGANTRLMPFYECDYLATANRAVQRRNRTERFLALALKKAGDEGKLHTQSSKAIQEEHAALRAFDLTKAFALPNPDPTVRRQLAADAVDVRTVPRGTEGPAGADKLKNVTRLYYRDQLTSIADGTNLVPVEALPYRGARRADPNSTAARNALLAASQGASQGGMGLLGGRFSSTRQQLASQQPVNLLGGNKDTMVMTQWRLFRELPPRDDAQLDAQHIPPVGALAQRFDEAGHALWQKAYRKTIRALAKDDRLILEATAQTTEARLGLNIGYNDIPAAGGPPAGPEDVEDMAHDRDVISRQLRELGDTLERERATQGKSQIRNEAAQTFLELTQRAGFGADATQENSQAKPTQFNFFDFGAAATKQREQRAALGSVEHGSGVPMESINSHLIAGSPVMQNPLTPVNYGYDLEETYRTEVPSADDNAEDMRSLKSNDLPSVASLWEQGSIAAGATSNGPTPRGSQSLGASASSHPGSSGAVDPRKTVREIFLKEAKHLSASIDKLLNSTNTATFRSSSGVIVKQVTLRDVLEYLRDVANIRTIVEKLADRALEQLQSRLTHRSPTDASPIVTQREALQLASSFRRQIERAHRLEQDGLNNLVPSNISRPTSDANKSVHSDARSTLSRHSRSTAGVSVRSSAVGQRRSRERAYDE